MQYKRVLVTGGAGFIGSAISLAMKRKFPKTDVVVVDNLIRRGSELNLPRLKQAGIEFYRADVRNPKDIDKGPIDLLIECSAEPSVLAGSSDSPRYVFETNTGGALNCFELARKYNAGVIFLSTSRVYPMDVLNNLAFEEEDTRFALSVKQSITGVSRNGVSEQLPLAGLKTFYGVSKYAAEMLLQEYRMAYGIRSVITRFGVIAGPWQMGKVDQGIVGLWVGRHILKKPLSYIGFGGTGKQVRDLLHVDDAVSLILYEMEHLDSLSGEVFNAGGGTKNSVSLRELTSICQKITGENARIGSIPKTRYGDVKWYSTDNTIVTRMTGWHPKKSVEDIVHDTCTWFTANRNELQLIYAE